jgi:predicted permease
MAAAMIMNSNSLPVALLQSLVLTVPGLQWDNDDTLDTMVARALSYLLLCGTMGQFVSSSQRYCIVAHPTIDRSFAGVMGSICLPKLSPRMRPGPLRRCLTRMAQ